MCTYILGCSFINSFMTFLKELAYVFLKNVCFPNLSSKRYFLRGYLEASANKANDLVKWEGEISTWWVRTPWSSSKESSWFQPALYLALQTLAKIGHGWHFLEFLLQMLKDGYRAGSADRAGYRTFIAQIPSYKTKTSLFVWNISTKIASNETLRWGILYLFTYLSFSLLIHSLHNS